jgi:hypothetical protein
MKDDDPQPQVPQIPHPDAVEPTPLLDDVGEPAPVHDALGAIESVLRDPRRVIAQLRRPDASRLIVQMVAASVACAAIYGIVVGSFSGGTQWWAAPVKISAGLLVAALICLPSLYIFAGLSGSGATLGEVVGLLAGLLLLTNVLLIGFAPVAWVFSQSTDSLAWMGFLHLTFWVVATAFGVRFLRAGIAPTPTRSTPALDVWLIVFVLVSLQMTTALRPILGTSDTFFPGEKKFFVAHWRDSMR